MFARYTLLLSSYKKKLRPQELPLLDAEIAGTRRRELNVKRRVMGLDGPRLHVQIVELAKKLLVKHRLRVLVKEGQDGTRPRRQLQGVRRHLEMQPRPRPREQRHL